MEEARTLKQGMDELKKMSEKGLQLQFSVEYIWKFSYVINVARATTSLSIDSSVAEDPT